MIVDDVRVVLEGPARAVARGASRIVEDAIEIFEGQMHMELSRDKGQNEGKTVAQASEKELRRRVATAMSKFGVKVKEKVRNLGVDFAAGGMSGTRGRNVLKARVREGARRVKRAVVVGARGRRRVVRSMVLPSVTYGSSSRSLPKVDEKFLRLEMAKTFGAVQGRSTTTRLLVEDVDPTRLSIEKAVMAGVCGLWDSHVEASVMEDAWKIAIMEKLSCVGTRKARQGGAAALLDALERIGWAAPAVDALRTRDGIVLCFGSRGAVRNGFEADPSLIRKLLRDDYEQVAMGESQVSRDLADICGLRGYPRLTQGRDVRIGEVQGGAAGEAMTEETIKAAKLWRRGKFKHHDDRPVPWIWPIAATVRAARKAGWDKGAASLRSLAEGGWPLQQKLWIQGRAEHNWCKCKAAAGTLWHKLAVCQLSEQHRSVSGGLEGRKEGLAAPWDPLYSRGALARPKDPPIVPELTWHETAFEGVEKVATKCVYTDGSAFGKFWKATRAGWAFVVLDEEGRWQWTARGTLAGPNCSSFRAELKALLEALRVTVGPVKIFIDNKAVVQGVKKGEDWCTSSRSSGADLWRQVWRYLNELEGNVEVVKVKAHSKWWDVVEGKIAHREYVGNMMADLAAKEAAKAAEDTAPAAPFNRQLTRIMRWLKWILKYTAEWTEDVEGQDKEETAENEAGLRIRTEEADEGTAGALGHELWKCRGEMTCRRCNGSWKVGEDREATAVSRKCGGCAAGRAATQSTGNINYIWAVYARSETTMCEKGAQLVSAPVPPKWMIQPRRIKEVANSGADLATLWRIAGMGELEGDAQQGGGGTREVDLPACAATFSERRPWLCAPSWMATWLVQPFERNRPPAPAEADWVLNEGRARKTEERGRRDHVIVVKGPIAYCARCAQFAITRVGKGLKGCAAPLRRTLNAAQSRLNKVKAGRHRVTRQRLG